MSILSALLSVAGLALLVTGAFIQFRHWSPYSGTQMDATEMRQFNGGAWIGAAGGLCILVAQFWR